MRLVINIRLLLGRFFRGIDGIFPLEGLSWGS